MSLMKKNSIIWLDGKYLPWEKAQVSVLTHTLHYGVGVFEGMRAYRTDRGTAIFRLYDHTQRLFNSAKILQINIPYTPEDINNLSQEIIRKNNLSACYVRPMVFYGFEGLGLHAKSLSVHVMMAAWEWGAYLGEEQAIKGVKVLTSSYTRNHPNSILGKAKANGNYMNSVLALKEAEAHGCDEALLLDNQGFVAEGSGENVFIVRKGALLTPEPTSALEGVTRDSICQLAIDMGIPVREKHITRDEVYIADEAFFTGTAAEVVHIRELDGRVIGDGKRGDITQRLQQAYTETVNGKNARRMDWLTYV
jgi:branched-chain amino acid aminotransferase